MNSYRIFLRDSLHYAGAIFAISPAAAIAAFCWPDKDDEPFFVAQLCDDKFSLLNLVDAPKSWYDYSSQTKELLK